MKITKPKKFIYFDYFAEVEPWLINKYPEYEQNIKKELAEEIDEMFSWFGLIGHDGYGLAKINLDIFKDNFLQSNWIKNIFADLIDLNDGNSEITFYIEDN